MLTLWAYLDAILLSTYGLLAPDIFCPWLAGARAIIPTNEEVKNGEYLLNLIAKEHVTVVILFPSMLEILLEQDRLETCTSLQHVISMGEPLSFQLQELFFRRLKANLYNAYGQAEAGSTIWKCERETKRACIPIGRPVANVKVYLLDDYLQLVPIGARGEIYISSPGMAQGYFKRPELTTERFIPNPFSDDPNAKMYKTGDFSRYLSDGNLEFLGRKDSQIKIHGFRVDSGGIESVLTQHPCIKKSTILLREDVPGKKRLVAYIVPHQGSKPSIQELRRFLEGRLPDYAMPSIFILMKKLPLLPTTFKVDKHALPAPNKGRPQLEEKFAPSHTSIEKQIVDIWSDVLELNRVGIHDKFFDLGGDSILKATNNAESPIVIAAIIVGLAMLSP